MASKRSQNLVLKVSIFVAMMWFLTAYVLNIRQTSLNELGAKELSIPLKAIMAYLKDHREEALRILQQIKTQGPHPRHDITAQEIGEKVQKRDDPIKVVPQDELGLKPPRQNTGPGEMGLPVKMDMSKLSPEDQAKYKEARKTHGYNVHIGDMISVHRSLPDFRDEKCKETGRYPTDLPASSVILCFYDETWSTLLRSVHSILDRTPEHLLTEIILVDDFSDLEHLKGPLDEYMAQYPKVKIVRTLKREGLTRARNIGAKAASGPVLTFLDAHIECTEGWLEPLVDVIRKNPNASVVPVIETIDLETFSIRPSGCSQASVSGFHWSLLHKWIPVPKRVRDQLKDVCDPTPSPTMPGGLFSIGKQFFEQLGYYDNHLDVWGGENMDISFKVWMCGGELYGVPCSHVGHIFRGQNPFSEKANVQFGKYFLRNSMRVAEIWLDDYKDIFYKKLGKQNLPTDIGDLSEAIGKRKELKCRSFDWFIKNVYPEVYIPFRGPAHGEVRNLGDISKTYCLDSMGNDADLAKPVGVYGCHELGGTQNWDITKQGEIRHEDGCVDYTGSGDARLQSCHNEGGNQMWIYKLETQQFIHKLAKKCLAIDISDRNKLKLTVDQCIPLNGYNQWSVSTINVTMLKEVEKKLL